MEIIFFIGLIFLIIASWFDLKDKEVHNRLIAIFFFLGIGLSIGSKNILSVGLGMALMGCLFFYMWKKEYIGGADVKILVTIVAYLGAIGIPNMLAKLMFFIAELGILGGIYGFIYLKLYKSKEEIPLVPIITFAYIISWVFQIN